MLLDSCSNLVMVLEMDVSEDIGDCEALVVVVGAETRVVGTMASWRRISKGFVPDDPEVGVLAMEFFPPLVPPLEDEWAEVIAGRLFGGESIPGGRPPALGAPGYVSMGRACGKMGRPFSEGGIPDISCCWSCWMS